MIMNLIFIALFVSFKMDAMQMTSLDQQWSFAGCSIHKNVLQEELLNVGLDYDYIGWWTDENKNIGWDLLPPRLQKKIIQRYYNHQYELYRNGCTKKGWQEGSINSLLIFIGSKPKAEYETSPLIYNVRQYMPSIDWLKRLYKGLPDDMCDHHIKNNFSQNSIMPYLGTLYKHYSFKAHEGSINGLVQNEKILFSGGSDGHIKKWNAKNLQQQDALVADFAVESKVCHFIIDRNEDIVTYGQNGSFIIINKGVIEPFISVPNVDFSIFTIYTYSKEKKLALVALQSNCIVFITGDPTKITRKNINLPMAVKIEQVGSKLICTGSTSLLSDSHCIQMYNPIKDTISVVSNVHNGKWISSLLALDDKKTFASGGADGHIKIWNTQKGAITLVKDYDMHVRVHSLGKLNKKIILAGTQNGIKIINVSKDEYIKTINVGNFAYMSLSAEAIDTLYAGDCDGNIHVYQLPDTIESIWSKLPLADVVLLKWACAKKNEPSKESNVQEQLVIFKNNIFSLLQVLENRMHK